MSCKHLDLETVPLVAKGQRFTPNWYWCRDCGALGIPKELLRKAGLLVGGQPVDDGPGWLQWKLPKRLTDS